MCVAYGSDTQSCCYVLLGFQPWRSARSTISYTTICLGVGILRTLAYVAGFICIFVVMCSGLENQGVLLRKDWKVSHQCYTVLTHFSWMQIVNLFWNMLLNHIGKELVQLHPHCSDVVFLSMPALAKTRLGLRASNPMVSTQPMTSYMPLSFGPS